MIHNCFDQAKSTMFESNIYIERERERKLVDNN